MRGPSPGPNGANRSDSRTRSRAGPHVAQTCPTVGQVSGERARQAASFRGALPWRRREHSVAAHRCAPRDARRRGGAWGEPLAAYLAASRSSMRRRPRMLLPLPSPPSPQWTSFSVCSTRFVASGPEQACEVLMLGELRLERLPHHRHLHGLSVAARLAVAAHARRQHRGAGPAGLLLVRGILELPGLQEVLGGRPGLAPDLGGMVLEVRAPPWSSVTLSRWMTPAMRSP